MPVEGEIINVYDVFDIWDHIINCYKEPVGHCTHEGSEGRLQRPSDPSTFPHSALHLPFRHLAINIICDRAVATSILLTRKL